jgi:hypothetical protein
MCQIVTPTVNNPFTWLSRDSLKLIFGYLDVSSLFSLMVNKPFTRVIQDHFDKEVYIPRFDGKFPLGISYPSYDQHHFDNNQTLWALQFGRRYSPATTIFRSFKLHENKSMYATVKSFQNYVNHYYLMSSCITHTEFEDQSPALMSMFYTCQIFPEIRVKNTNTWYMSQRKYVYSTILRRRLPKDVLFSSYLHNYSYGHGFSSIFYYQETLYPEGLCARVWVNNICDFLPFILPTAENSTRAMINYSNLKKKRSVFSHLVKVSEKIDISGPVLKDMLEIFMHSFPMARPVIFSICLLLFQLLRNVTRRDFIVLSDMGVGHYVGNSDIHDIMPLLLKYGKVAPVFAFISKLTNNAVDALTVAVDQYITQTNNFLTIEDPVTLYEVDSDGDYTNYYDDCTERIFYLNY